MENKYYPIFINLKHKKCIIIGGGHVAERKVKGLIDTGAHIIIVSPYITDELALLAKEGKIIHLKKNYEKNDIKDAFLVIGATDSRNVNEEIRNDCRKHDIPANIVDSPEDCTFTVPSVIKRGPLTITISTDGKSPALSKKIRKEIENIYGEEYGKFAVLLGNLRERIQKEIPEEKERKSLWEKLLEANIPSLIKEGKDKEIEELVEKIIKSEVNSE